MGDGDFIGIDIVININMCVCMTELIDVNNRDDMCPREKVQHDRECVEE